MSYPDLSIETLRDVHAISPLPSTRWLEIREKFGERLPVVDHIQRDAALRKLLTGLNPKELWTDEGDPTPKHMRILSWGYTPNEGRLNDWLEWHDLNG